MKSITGKKVFRIPYALVLELAQEKHPDLNEAAALEQYKKTNKAIANQASCKANAVLAAITYRVALELWQIYTIRKN